LTLCLALLPKNLSAPGYSKTRKAKEAYMEDLALLFLAILFFAVTLAMLELYERLMGK
jgi:hypothetical protein